MDNMKKVETINNAIDRLETYRLCNEEYLDADDLGALLTTVEELKEVRDELNGTKRTVYTNYAEADDRTFVMEDIFVEGELQSTECIGWYCGEPNEEYTAMYSNRKMKAEY